MEDLNIQKMNGAQWGNVLDKAAQTPAGKMGGLHVIAINSDKEMQVFTDVAQAKEAGYKTLSLSEICKYTKAKMKDCSDQQTKFKAAMALQKFGSLSGRAKLEKQASALAVKLVPTLRTTTPSQLEGIKENIAYATDITFPAKRSNNVVIFLSSDNPSGVKTTVVKTAKNPRAAVAADRFYERMGFTTPNSFAMDKDDPTSKDLLGKIDSFPEMSGEKKTKLEKEKTERKHILVMDRIKGRPFNELGVDQVLGVCNNPGICRDIGRMMLFDAFIGNWDRVNEGQCNLGNFILLDTRDSTAEVTPEGKSRIALIDHEVEVNKTSLPTLHSRIETLLDDTKCETTIDQLFAKFMTQILNQGGDVNLLTEDLASRAKEQIKEGIREASKEILESFDKKSAAGIIDDVNLPKSKQNDPKLLFKMYTTLEKSVKY